MESQIREIHQLLVDQKISCTSLIQEKLAALKPNSHNTVNSLLEDLALEKAKKVDEKIKNSEKIGLLEGIPFGLKDVYMLQGTLTTASSEFLKSYKSAYTATAIQKLIDAGAIPIVKENGDSFGHGSSSENTIFGAVKNAFNTELVAGGSSGGSAVNVAKKYTVFSIGGDTGGSVRQPSGYNKVYGLKPTYGRISRYGLLAYASSTDCVGPITTSIEDLRIVLNIMSGKDVKDQTTYVSDEISEVQVSKSDTIKTIGYFKNFTENDAIDATIKSDFLIYIEKIKATGINMIALDFFDAETLISTYYTLAMAETASNLSRLDGTNYGNRMEGENLKDSYSISRSKNFSEETKRRIVGGNQVLSQGFADDIYIKALSIRNEISENFEKDFQEVAIIISPVTPNSPPKIGDSLKNPLAMYLSDAYTVGFSLGQLPTLTIPQGTLAGVQLTAAKNNDDLLLKFANFLKEVI
ncbi:MAG: glutamyl-tRNA amidotransferase [Cryomorphaceae bacterium BACL22 MAG-120619-bin32]|jgi:aspartyl-tRNA(Asn)/glutamyl-tRNA(Gln) amidotransferase subunit A|nr:MAG: glutamyl-tRNA amidotransferase [Cryomorphaceae bacterium BACL22 MAG-120619-bin32]